MATEKACKTCKRILEGDICPVCKDSQLTTNWKGYFVVMDPEKSEMAKKMNIKTPGKYTIRLGK